jgi:hypothetical protein
MIGFQKSDNDMFTIKIYWTKKSDEQSLFKKRIFNLIQSSDYINFRGKNITPNRGLFLYFFVCYPFQVFRCLTKIRGKDAYI